MKIFCVGPIWQGSNAGALFRAFQKCNHAISIIDENYFISLNSDDLLDKIVARAIRGHQIAQLNKIILRKARSFRPDLVVIYKGSFILPKLLRELKLLNIPIVNFFPDVSFSAHGKLISKTLPLYDHIFTTKTFGINDLKENFNLTNSSFIPHGFDEDLHYPHVFDKSKFSDFECDLSFIGDRDGKKERTLTSIVERNQSVNLNVWGRPWIESRNDQLLRHVKGESIFGDLYPIAIQSSKINLGLLSERRIGASSGDLITSRTFHIPACGGFMLHERTEDVLNYFKEGEEIECFSDTEELNSKIEFYLKNDSLREQISKSGLKRCIKEHSLKHRAGQLIETLIAKGLLKDSL